MVFTTKKKEKNGVTKNIDINIVSYLISMARSRVPTIVEIETEIDIPLTSATLLTNYNLTYLFLPLKRRLKNLSLFPKPPKMMTLAEILQQRLAHSLFCDQSYTRN